jgi:hypothetical protein
MGSKRVLSRQLGVPVVEGLKLLACSGILVLVHVKSWNELERARSKNSSIVESVI